MRALIALLIVTAGVYGGTLRNGYVYEDTHGQELTWAALKVPNRHLLPGRWLSDWSVWAIGQAPVAQHVVNTTLHLLNVALVWAIASVILEGSAGAIIVAAIFALSPINTEAVAYISARTDLLSTGFLLLSVWAVVAEWTLLALPPLGLALIAKESAIAGIPLLLLAWAVTRETTPWRFILAVLVVGGAFRLGLDIERHAINPVYAVIDPYFFSGPSLWLSFLSFWRLIGLAIMPVGLSVEHDYARVPILIGWLAALATGSLGILAWWVREDLPILSFGLAWMLLALLPRFVLRLPEPISEHQFYLASVGMALVLSEGVRFFLEPSRA